MAGHSQLGPTCHHTRSVGVDDGTSCLAGSSTPSPVGHTPRHALLRKAILTYYIAEGILVGTVNDHLVHIIAYSGGGGGSTSKKGPDEPQNVNNVYATGRVTKEPTRGGPLKESSRGGPLPVGAYLIDMPAPWHKGIAARLQPLPSEAAFEKATGRGAFLIHHTGPQGSDGCIVPRFESDFQNLMNGLTLDGGGHLTVLEATEGSRFV